MPSSYFSRFLVTAIVLTFSPITPLASFCFAEEPAWADTYPADYFDSNGTIYSGETTTATGDFWAKAGSVITVESETNVTYAVIGDYVDGATEFLYNKGTVTYLEVWGDGNVTNSGTVTNLWTQAGAFTSNTGTVDTVTGHYDTFENTGTITSFNAEGTVLSNGLLQSSSTASVDVSAKIQDLTVTLGVVSNYAIIENVTLSSGYMINHAGATLNSITMGSSTTTASATEDDLNAVFINYSTMTGSDGAAALTMNSGTAYNFGSIDGLVISNAHFFNTASKYQISIKYDDNGEPVYETVVTKDGDGNEVSEQVLQYEYTLSDSSAGWLDNVTIKSGGILYNYDGASVGTVTMNDGGEIYNQYDIASDEGDSKIEDFDAAPTIDKIVMDGGKLNNSDNGDYADSVVTTLEMNGGTTYNHGTIKDVTIKAGIFESNGYTVEITATGGDLDFKSGGVNLSLDANGVSEIITNESGSYIFSATLENVTVENLGIFGVLGTDQYDANDFVAGNLNIVNNSLSTYEDHVYAELILGDGVKFYNNKMDDEEGVIMYATVQTGATLYNAGTVGSYECTHGDMNYGTLTLSGGTVSNSGSGFIYDVNMGSGTLTSDGTDAEVHILDMTGGTVTNSGGSLMSFVTMSDGSLTNTGDGSEIIFLNMTDGTATNGSTSDHSAYIQTVTASEDAVVSNYGDVIYLYLKNDAVVDGTGGTFYNYSGADVSVIEMGSNGVMYNYSGATIGVDMEHMTWVEVNESVYDSYSGDKQKVVDDEGNTVYSIYQEASTTGATKVSSGAVLYNHGKSVGEIIVSPYGSDVDAGTAAYNYSTGTAVNVTVGINGTFYNDGQVTGNLTLSQNNQAWEDYYDGGTAYNYGGGKIAKVTISIGGTFDNYGDVTDVLMNSSNAILNNMSGDYSYTFSDGVTTDSTVSGNTSGTIKNLDLDLGTAINKSGAYISAVDMSGGTLTNDGQIDTSTVSGGSLTNNAGGVIGLSDSKITSLTISGEDAVVLNEGTIYSVYYTDGSLTNKNGGTIDALTAVGSEALTSESTATISNEWYATIYTVSLENVIMDNSWYLGSDGAEDFGGSVTLNDDSVLNNKGGMVYNVTANTGATLNNITGGYVNDVTVNSGASVYNSGYSEYSASIISTATVYDGGYLENASTVYTVYAGDWGGSSGGVVYNTSDGTITTVTVLNGGLLTNSGTITTLSSVWGVNSSVINNENASIGFAAVSVNGSLDNSGDIGTLTVSGANWGHEDGDAYVDNIFYGTVNNLAGGSITMAYVSYVYDADGTLTDSEYGALSNAGSIKTAAVGNNGILYNGSSTSSLSTTDDANSSDSATIENLFVQGADSFVVNYADGVITNAYVGFDEDGKDGSAGNLDNYGAITYAVVKTGNAVLNNYKGSIVDVTASWGGTFNNYSNVTGLISVGTQGVVNNHAEDGALVDTVTLDGGEYHHYGDSSDDYESTTSDTLSKLNLQSGTFTVESGTLTISQIWNNTETGATSTDSTIAVESGATLILGVDSGAPVVDILDNDGTVESKGDMIINSNVTGTGDLVVQNKLTINNLTDSEGAVVAGSAANITANILAMEAGSLTLTEVLTLTSTGASDAQEEATHTASGLTAGTVDMQQSATLSVVNGFQASKVVINADGETSGTMAGSTIITTDTLTVGSSGMNFELTEASLLQFMLDYDGNSLVTLLSIESGYDTDSIDNFSLTIVDDDGNEVVTIYNEESYNINYDGYFFNVNYADGVVSSVNIYLAKVPEPSTTALGLMALAGLAARRRRKA